MVFCLLKNKTGVIVTRKPFIISSGEEITIAFENAPILANVIFTDEAGKNFYRSLENGSCQIKADRLNEGTIKVVVTVPTGEVSPPVWKCEGLLCQKKGKTIVISPNETELSSIVADLRIEVSNIMSLFEKQQKEIKQLDSKVSAISDGYDDL